MQITIDKPAFFSFAECIWYLDRGFDDCMHVVSTEAVTKLIPTTYGLLLIRLSEQDQKLLLEVLNDENPNPKALKEAEGYVRSWLNLDTDLKPFYDLASKDKLLHPLSKTFSGLRLIGIEDLFEALCWAIIGQQVNLTFAYKIKAALVYQYGQSISFNDRQYYTFPSPETISKLSEKALKDIQFSGRKAAYVINLAHLFNKGLISKTMLLSLKEPEEIIKKLVAIKGIGPWTANYVAMRCLKVQDAYPLEDAGLHNAIKNQLGLDNKPSLEEVKQLGNGWRPWRAYATLFLWRSLAVKKP